LHEAKDGEREEIFLLSSLLVFSLRLMLRRTVRRDDIEQQQKAIVECWMQLAVEDLMLPLSWLVVLFCALSGKKGREKGNSFSLCWGRTRGGDNDRKIPAKDKFLAGAIEFWLSWLLARSKELDTVGASTPEAKFSGSRLDRNLQPKSDPICSKPTSPTISPQHSEFSFSPSPAFLAFLISSFKLQPIEWLELARKPLVNLCVSVNCKVGEGALCSPLNQIKQFSFYAILISQFSCFMGGNLT
jgi:hypothetical protein